MVHARRCHGIEAFLIDVRFCKGYRNDSNIIDHLCQRPSTLTKDIVEAPKRSQVTNARTCPLLPISMQTMQNTLLQLQLQLVIMQDATPASFAPGSNLLLKKLCQCLIDNAHSFAEAYTEAG
jgi:hypothetical protein